MTDRRAICSLPHLASLKPGLDDERGIDCIAGCSLQGEGPRPSDVVNPYNALLGQVLAMEPFFFKMSTCEAVRFFCTSDGGINLGELGDEFGLDPLSIKLDGSSRFPRENLRTEATWNRIRSLLVHAGTEEDPVMVTGRPGHRDSRGDLLLTMQEWFLQTVEVAFPSFGYQGGASRRDYEYPRHVVDWDISPVISGFLRTLDTVKREHRRVSVTMGWKMGDVAKKPLVTRHYWDVLDRVGPLVLGDKYASTAEVKTNSASSRTPVNERTS